MSQPATYIKSMVDCSGLVAHRLHNNGHALGPDANIIKNSWAKMIQQQAIPLSNDNNLLRLDFMRLACEWQNETAHRSSITEIVTHPAYQAIIGMGARALPFIFDSLAIRADHWFWALKAITGADPVPPKFRGNMDRMSSSWLNWWDQNRWRYEREAL